MRTKEICLLFYYSWFQKIKAYLFIEVGKECSFRIGDSIVIAIIWFFFISKMMLSPLPIQRETFKSFSITI